MSRRGGFAPPTTDLFDVIQRFSQRFPHRARLALLALLLAGLGAPTLLYPYGRDQAMFAYVGQVWREGGLPYRDAWDVKLPAIYAVYALVGGTEWGPRLLDLFAAAAMAAGLLALERRIVPAARGVGVLAASISIVYTLGAFDFWNLAQTETLIAPLSTGAMLLAFSRRWLLAGLLAGCAATFKTTAVLALVPVLAACVLLPEDSAADGTRTARGRLQTCGAATLGAAIPALLFAAYFGARGALPFLWELIATQAEYAGGDPRLTGQPAPDLIRMLGLTGYLPLVAVSLVGVVVGGRKHLGAKYTPARQAQFVLGIWWLAALAQVLIQRRFYLYHWAVLTPSAAWMAAALLSDFWQPGSTAWGSARLRRFGVACGMLVLTALAVAPRLPSWQLAAKVAAGRATVADYRGQHYGVFQYEPTLARQAAEHIRSRSSPEDPLMVVAFEPELYLYSGRRAPTRHASDAPIAGETSIREARRRTWFRELLADLARQPPLYLVERPHPRSRPEWFQPLWDLIRRQYRHEATYGLLKIYRRR